jgi:hypothetical protein
MNGSRPDAHEDEGLFGCHQPQSAKEVVIAQVKHRAIVGHHEVSSHRHEALQLQQRPQSSRIVKLLIDDKLPEVMSIDERVGLLPRSRHNGRPASGLIPLQAHDRDIRLHTRRFRSRATDGVADAPSSRR